MPLYVYLEFPKPASIKRNVQCQRRQIYKRLAVKSFIFTLAKNSTSHIVHEEKEKVKQKIRYMIRFTTRSTSNSASTAFKTSRRTLAVDCTLVTYALYTEGNPPRDNETIEEIFSKHTT